MLDGGAQHSIGILRAYLPWKRKGREYWRVQQLWDAASRIQHFACVGSEPKRDRNDDYRNTGCSAPLRITPDDRIHRSVCAVLEHRHRLRARGQCCECEHSDPYRRANHAHSVSNLGVNSTSMSKLKRIGVTVRHADELDETVPGIDITFSQIAHFSPRRD